MLFEEPPVLHLLAIIASVLCNLINRNPTKYVTNVRFFVTTITYVYFPFPTRNQAYID